MSKQKTTYEVFKNAPIVEALLDIRIKRIENPNDELFQEFSKLVLQSYPERQPRKIFSGGIEFSLEDPSGSPKAVGSSLMTNGFAYLSPDKTKVIQARQDGYSFSKLKPYEDWPKLRDEAKSYWFLYCQSLKPAAVERLTLRYINRIFLPLPVQDFKEYFLTWLDIAPTMPQGISEMFFRVVLPHPEVPDKIVAAVTATFETPVNNKLGCIFDIEVSTVSNIRVDDPSIWDLFEKMREYKDDIFFNSITEKAKGLFR